MKMNHKALYVFIAVLSTLAGCSSSSSGDNVDTGNNPTIEPAASYVFQVPAVDSANFYNNLDEPFLINNPYLPLEPGTILIYESETEEGLTREVFDVTYDTLDILGVTCTVVHDQAFVNVEGEWILLEDTHDWHAQDNDGNVWYFGEDTLEYLYDASWNLVGTSTEGSWKAGVDGATAGIVMLAFPSPGISYRQEFLEGVAEDQAKILRLNARVSIGYCDFNDCLETKEWTRLEPGAIEHKFYAPEIGLVYIEELKGKTVKTELVEIQHY